MKPKLALAALLVLVLVAVGANATNRRLIALEKRLDDELGKPTDIGTITTLKTDNEILATEVGHLKDRTAALEKRVDELETWKKNLHLEVWNPSVGKPKCCTINSDPEISTVKP